MKLAIVAYPILDEIDRLWIESSRARHDPQASRIDVHFTLVFPVEAVASALGPEIAVVAQSSHLIPFTIRRTKVVRDPLGNGSHIFLVPDEGSAEIATLHDRLYAGALRAHLRSDIPFVPHMTVGAAPDSQTAETFAEELGVRTRIIRGTVAHVELVDVGTPRVQSISIYALGNAKPR
jgi:2'-5' RNA ligase